MAGVALDADVLIGFLDAADPRHEVAVRRLGPCLTAEHECLVAATVYAEILVHPIRRGADRLVEDFIASAGIQVVPVDRATARRAAELRASHPALRLPDALALAAALVHDAEFLTLDRRLARISQSAR